MALDVFSLMGKISIDYADAQNAIDRVTRSAGSAAGSLGDVDDAADGAESSVEGAGRAADGADNSFSAWKMTLANLAANVIQNMISKCTELAKSVADLGIDFTSTMSEVQAISGATDGELAALTATAREYGSTTVFSATEAAEALKYMSLAGWSAEESTSALGGVLDLAAASGMELGRASDMVTDYLSAFGLQADKSAYFADMLAYAQSHSNTTAEQLGEAYRNCAANLNAAGQDVETVTSLLEAMANQGYKGSEAGTALSAMMRDITNAMDDGKIAIGNTTIAVTDASGNYRDLTDILKDVEAATDGMGSAERAAALSSTFTADSTKGLNLLLNEGIDSVSGYESELRKADGAASDMAATMNDNLKGDLANMNSAFDELKLKIFDGAESPLRGLVQFITGSVVPALTTLIQNFDTIAPVIAGVTTALIAFKAAMTISSIIDAATKAFKAYQLANEGATVAQWLLNAAMEANPIVLVVSLIAGLIAAIIVLWNTNEDFRNGVIAVWEAVKSAFSTAINAIVNFVGNLVDGIKSGLQKAWDTVTSIFDSIVQAISAAWETIKNVVQVGIMFIQEILSAAFSLLTMPWQFIWENFGSYLTAAWEAIKSTVSNALTAIQTFISNVWNAIVSFLTPILDSIKNTFSNIWNAISSTISTVLSTIQNAISNAFNAVSSTVSNIMNTVKSTISNAWSAVTSTVSNAINSVKSTISSGLNAAASTVTSILNNIKAKFQSILDGAKNVVSNAINAIKSKFNFSWSLPHLKLPHISISGSFSINPPSVPHFGISWYKKAMEDGMIMNTPTIFGFDSKTNQFMGGGEAGSETVVGTENLMGMIKTAVAVENQAMSEELERLISLLTEFFPQVLSGMGRSVVLDTGAVVGEIAPAIDTELGKIQGHKGRGN